MGYKIEILYSKEDEGFIAVIPELPGCSVFGETREDALKEIENSSIPMDRSFES